MREVLLQITHRSGARATHWYLLGLLEQILSDPEASAAAFRAGLAMAPGSGMILHNLAIAIHGSGPSSVEEERSLLEQAIASDPAMPEPHFALGVMLMNRRDRAGAIRHFQAFLSKRHPYLGVYVNHARQSIDLMTGRFPGGG